MFDDLETDSSSPKPRRQNRNKAPIVVVCVSLAALGIVAAVWFLKQKPMVEQRGEPETAATVDPTLPPETIAFLTAANRVCKLVAQFPSKAAYTSELKKLDELYSKLHNPAPNYGEAKDNLHAIELLLDIGRPTKDEEYLDQAKKTAKETEGLLR